MEDWIYWASDRVHELALADPDYRSLAKEQEALSVPFEEVLGSLSDTERDLILDYLNNAVDLEYQQTRLAYLLGKGTLK